jgi:hypothetical protein
MAEKKIGAALTNLNNILTAFGITLAAVISKLHMASGRLQWGCR